MDNQQERPLSLEFLAGLITGEGSFSIGIYTGKYLAFKPIFQIKMNDVETIDAAHRSFVAHGLPVYRQKQKDRGQYTLEARGLKRAKRYTDTFVPLLTGQKKAAAEVLGEYIDHRLTNGRNAWGGYTETDVQFVERLRAINGVKNGKKTPVEILRDYTLRSGRDRTRQDIVRTP